MSTRSATTNATDELAAVRALYLDVMKKSLMGLLAAEPYRILELSRKSRRGRVLLWVQRALASRNLTLVGRARRRDEGHDWPIMVYPSASGGWTTSSSASPSCFAGMCQGI